MDNPTTLIKLIELREKQTLEQLKQRKEFLEAEQRYLERLEEVKLHLYIAQRYMK